ncbi:hypothetical protein [Plantactinospora endophytica]|uniref:DUF222 domain-containing protein n=1 Tax=Plantactinospora endophytica TaxID=673535 RepID=A0ABQ4DYD9_9ACTN|nr:hypothetical protein [Plantactinospora endophytica]GIG87470.1 hypothetical protein Pen02_24060 [Plantactinospora endophytica]
MSIIEELGARVRAASDELPVELVIKALDHLKLASERLRWVRQESADPMGVPELSAATEHLETAGHALRLAQDQFATYLAAIGLARDGSPAPGPERPPPSRGAGTADDSSGPVRKVAPAATGGWWSVRVAELFDRRDTPAPKPDHEITDAEELLRRVTDGVRSGDRTRLHTELRAVEANVGLGLASVAPPMLRDLAGALLGHQPRAADLPRLRREVTGQVQELVPNLPPGVLDTLLSRVCRMPPPKEPVEQPHPADPAVAAGVLTGLLMRRLGVDQRPVTARAPRDTHA